MIKKTLLSLFVWFVWLIWFSNAWTYKWLNTLVEDRAYPNYSFTVVNRWWFLTNIPWMWFDLIYLRSTSGSYPRVIFFYWDTEWYLYSFRWASSNNYITQWRVQSFSYCDYFDSSHWNSAPSNCSVVSYDKDLVWAFLSKVSYTESFAYHFDNDRYNSSMYICVSSLEFNKSICFCWWNRSSISWFSCYLDTSSSEWYSYSTQISDIPSSKIWRSPWAWSSWGWNNGWTVSNSLNNSSAIEYLEKVYNFNTSLCYVWIDDFSVNYWGVWSFIQWWWKTIFELFDYINWTSESVSNVWVWINSRIINYQQWFDNNWKTAEPTYLTDYSNWQISVYYDNLQQNERFDYYNEYNHT